jgi:hypothetical protein
MIVPKRTNKRKVRTKELIAKWTNCLKLYEEHLAGDKWEYMVTLDEAWVMEKEEFAMWIEESCHLKIG